MGGSLKCYFDKHTLDSPNSVWYPQFREGLEPECGVSGLPVSDEDMVPAKGFLNILILKSVELGGREDHECGFARLRNMQREVAHIIFFHR